jgi:hypothetical protein
MKTENKLHHESWHYSHGSKEDMALRLYANKYTNVYSISDRDEKGKRVYILHADYPASKATP